MPNKLQWLGTDAMYAMSNSYPGLKYMIVYEEDEFLGFERKEYAVYIQPSQGKIEYPRIGLKSYEEAKTWAERFDQLDFTNMPRPVWL